MKKLLSTALLATFAFFAIVGCAEHKKENPKDVEKKKAIIAVIPKINNPIFDEVNQNAKAMGDSLGVIVTWEAPSGVEAAEQSEIIDNLIKYKVDAILISCANSAEVTPAINRAVEAGITVATFDSDAPSSKRLFYVGTNNLLAGQMAGLEMKRLFEAKKMTPEKIQLISGNPDAYNMIRRQKGFSETVTPQAISGLTYSFDINDYAGDLINDAIKSNPKAIQFIWGVPAIEGIATTEGLDKYVQKGGIVVFFDTSDELMKNIKKYPNVATIKQDFKAMAREGILHLDQSLQGKQVMEGYIFDPIVINHLNIDSISTK